MLINVVKRNQSTNQQKHVPVILSSAKNCERFISMNYYRHKDTCYNDKIFFSRPTPPELIASSSDYDKRFLDIMLSILPDEAGNLCKTDESIKLFGMSFGKRTDRKWIKAWKLKSPLNKNETSGTSFYRSKEP